MVAKPGEKNYSRLSVATYYRANAEILEFLPPRVFYPRPEVDSAIVKLTPKRRPFKVNEELFFNLLRGLFSHRKKTLRKALFFSLLGIFNVESKDKRKEIVDSFDEKLLERRVFTLSPEELAKICDALEEKL
jgi:16S rRNA (adenine1518-N6/adenine1519-N6)-dimethyltransferase